MLDRYFCVLEGMIELRKVDVFEGALIKTLCYQPNHIKGDMMDTHLQEKEVGVIDLWNGTLNDTQYAKLCLKEPDCVMKIMATYGELTLPEVQWQ